MHCLFDLLCTMFPIDDSFFGVAEKIVSIFLSLIFAVREFNTST